MPLKQRNQTETKQNLSYIRSRLPLEMSLFLDRPKREYFGWLGNNIKQILDIQ